MGTLLCMCAGVTWEGTWYANRKNANEDAAMQRSSPCALGRRASASAAGSSAASVRHAQARTSTCDMASHA